MQYVYGEASEGSVQFVPTSTRLPTMETSEVLFMDLALGGVYTYDFKGNMTKDSLNNLDITCNYLNLSM